MGIDCSMVAESVIQTEESKRFEIVFPRGQCTSKKFPQLAQNKFIFKL